MTADTIATFAPSIADARALRVEALRVGDSRTVRLCDRFLTGATMGKRAFARLPLARIEAWRDADNDLATIRAKRAGF